ncbi:uncharacterized protein LOC144911634 isoform X1 [Branchiostoma floridae x Branchiostoma belcheri]
MAPKTGTCSLILLLLLLAEFSEERGLTCQLVDCAWGPWSSWSDCTAPCGNSGTWTRNRGVAHHAQCGGVGCAGPSSQTGPCNRFCYNGGTPLASHCACESDHWNTCCQSACTPISHCASLSCTHGSNQQCVRCDGDFGVLGQAYHNLGTSCRKACSWREDSNSCYPGTCASGVQSCTCAPGFGGPHCRTVLQAPTFHDCSYELTGNNGIATSHGSCSRSSEDGDAAHINMAHVERIRVRWTATFQPPNLPAPPVYVKSMALGITGGSIAVSLRDETAKTASATTTCSTAIGRGTADVPEQGVFTCEEDISVEWTASNRQGIQILLMATAGGNVHLYDRDSNSAVKVKYFTALQANHTADIIFNLFRFDLKPPRQGNTSSPEGCTDIPWVLYGGLAAGVVLFLIITVAVCYGWRYLRKGRRETIQTPAPCSQNIYGNTAYSRDNFDNATAPSTGNVVLQKELKTEEHDVEKDYEIEKDYELGKDHELEKDHEYDEPSHY